jgi:aconitate hydratase
MFQSTYGDVYKGDDNWRSLPVPKGDTYAWDAASTYVKNPPYFENMPREPAAIKDISGARVLALLGDSITTDHISPAGSIKKDGPAGKYLIAHGVQPKDFNSYGSRRGNHEVMARGTFANVRLRNRLNPQIEGGITTYLPTGETMSIFDAAEKYQKDKTPLIIIAGTEYGTGSSRDWAAKGPLLQGVRAVIAESYERIHRSNLIGMGILPLQFHEGEDCQALGLTGKEVFSLTGIADAVGGRSAQERSVNVHAQREDGNGIDFTAIVRIDSQQEAEYYRHGGILQYVLRQLLAS